MVVSGRPDYNRISLGGSSDQIEFGSLIVNIESDCSHLGNQTDLVLQEAQAYIESTWSDGPDMNLGNAS